ncbi:MAG: porin [Sideroxydans sp.]|nr:porin [Sideroxydans sp.]
MKRNRHIPLLAALFAASPALADNGNITFYGMANLSLDRIDTGTATNGTQGTSNLRVASNGSRFGLKGAEDVGGGLSVKWQIESLVSLDNAGGTFATRNSFASLVNKAYGSVLLGRYDTPYKVITRKLDNFADSIADNRSLFGTVSNASASKSFVTKQPDVFAYTSPDLNGATISLAHVNLSETATKATDKKDSANSLSFAYDNGTLYGAMGYETHTLESVRAGGKESAWNMALAYKVEDYSLAFVYEKTKDELGGAAAPAACAALTAGADCLGHSAYYLTGKYTLDSDSFKIAYTSAGKLGGRSNTGASQFSLGYDHRLSKRSTLFALYTRLSNESAASYGLGSAAYTSSNTAAIGAGADFSAFSFGLKHSF